MPFARWHCPQAAQPREDGPRIDMQVRGSLKLNMVPFDEIIAGWSELSDWVAGWFRDPEKVAFVLVTIPETLGVYLSRPLVGQLEQFGLRLRHIVINQVITDPTCCFHRQRQAMQAACPDLLSRE